MKKAILFTLLVVFSISSFADFMFKVYAAQDNDYGWVRVDSAYGVTHAYIVYRKVDPKISKNKKYSSITLSGYDVNSKGVKLRYDGSWAYWKSTNTGTKSSGRAQGYYYTCTTYKNAEYLDENGIHKAIVEVYYFPKTKVYNVCICIVNNYTGRIIQRLWYKN